MVLATLKRYERKLLTQHTAINAKFATSWRVQCLRRWVDKVVKTYL